MRVPLLCFAKGEAQELAGAALRTNGKIDAGELLHGLLPGFARKRGCGIEVLFLARVRGWHLWWVDKGSCGFEFGFGVAGSHEAVVTDFHKA